MAFPALRNSCHPVDQISIISLHFTNLSKQERPEIQKRRDKEEAKEQQGTREERQDRQETKKTRLTSNMTMTYSLMIII